MEQELTLEILSSLKLLIDQATPSILALSADPTRPSLFVGYGGTPLEHDLDARAASEAAAYKLHFALKGILPALIRAAESGLLASELQDLINKEKGEVIYWSMLEEKVEGEREIAKSALVALYEATSHSINNDGVWLPALEQAREAISLLSPTKKRKSRSQAKHLPGDI